MPPALKDRHGLTPQMRRACALEATGAMNLTEIASEVGVSKGTLSLWRKKQAYRNRRDELASAADDKALEDARILRTGAGYALGLALKRGIEMLSTAEQDEMDADTVTKLGRLCLDIWRTTGSQTGIGEVTRAEVTVTPSDPEALDRLLTMYVDEG